MVIPMKGQYEQQCNAAALEQMGVPVIKKLKGKYLDKIIAWTASTTILSINYPDITEQIIDTIIEKYGKYQPGDVVIPGEHIFSVKKLKNASLGKILKEAGR